MESIYSVCHLTNESIYGKTRYLRFFKVVKSTLELYKLCDLLIAAYWGTFCRHKQLFSTSIEELLVYVCETRVRG